MAGTVDPSQQAMSPYMKKTVERGERKRGYNSWEEQNNNWDKILSQLNLGAFDWSQTQNTNSPSCCLTNLSCQFWEFVSPSRGLIILLLQKESHADHCSFLPTSSVSTGSAKISPGSLVCRRSRVFLRTMLSGCSCRSTTCCFTFTWLVRRKQNAK